LCFRSIQAEQQPVVEARRVVDTILVEDQCVGECADLQQTMPVGVVPGQARDLEPHNHASVSHADIGDQTLKTFAPGCRCARLALVVVNDDNLIVAPAQCCGTIA
jgi:hypothetical protein